MIALLRRISYGLLSIVDLALQLVIPPSHRRICYASIPDFTDNAFYLFAHALRTRRDLEHVWLVREPVSTTRVESEFARLVARYGQRGHRLRVLPWRSPSAYWAFLRSRTVVHTHGLYNFSRAALWRIRVGLWHGMPIKCIGSLNTISPNPTPQFATHYIATSHFFRYVLAAAFDTSPARVLVIGQPRNDALRAQEYRVRDAADIRRRLGLREAQPFVLWMPTYRAEGKALAAPASRLRSFMDDIDHATLERFLSRARERDCVIVVKLHPYERATAHEALPVDPYLRVFNDDQWRASDVQLYDALGIAAGLISDVSSVLIDFAVTGRPLGCFGFDQRTYTRDLVFPPDYLVDALGLSHIDNPSAAVAFVDRAVDGVPQFSRCAKIFVHGEHSASESVLQLCLESRRSRNNQSNLQ